MGQPDPMVSVVIPSYNYGRFVADAVDSALAQTMRPHEVIVVDDGSTDDTRARMENYGHPVRYIYQENRGLSAARNTGIRAATGDWIGFLDADDQWHRQMIETLLAAVQTDGSVAAVGSPFAAEMPEVLPPNPPMRTLSVADFLVSTPISGSSTLVRRDCFNVAGFFNEALTSVEDRDMWLRLVARYRVIQVLSPCWTYRRHTGQMTRNADRMLDNYRRVLGEFFRSHPQYCNLYHLGMSQMYLDATWAYLQQGQTGSALLKLLFSIWHKPFRLEENARRRPFLRTKLAVRMLMRGAGVQPS